MSPNGDAFLLNPDGPEGPTRFPQARSIPTNSRTIYVSGIASILPDGTVVVPPTARYQMPEFRHRLFSKLSMRSSRELQTARAGLPI